MGGGFSPLRPSDRYTCQLLLDALTRPGDGPVRGEERAGRGHDAGRAGIDGFLRRRPALRTLSTLRGHSARLVLLHDARGLDLHRRARGVGVAVRCGDYIPGAHTADVIVDADGVALRAAPGGIVRRAAALGVTALRARAMHVDPRIF